MNLMNVLSCFVIRVFIFYVLFKTEDWVLKVVFSSRNSVAVMVVVGLKLSLCFCRRLDGARCVRHMRIFWRRRTEACGSFWMTTMW